MLSSSLIFQIDARSRLPLDHLKPSEFPTSFKGKATEFFLPVNLCGPYGKNLTPFFVNENVLES